MRLAFIDDQVHAYLAGLPSTMAGAERQQWLLGRALAAQGWSVVFGVNRGLPPGARSMYEGVEFVGIGSGSTLANWHRFLRSEKPDWSYWRGAYHMWGPAIELAKHAGVRTVFAAAFDRDVQPARALSLRPRWWPLYAWALVRADRILLQHSGQLAALNRVWRSKASVVHSIAGTPAGGKSHGTRAPYVAWVGMLRQHKRPDLLLEIARQARDVRFVVCGAPSSHRSPEGFGERIIEGFHALPNIEYLGQVLPDRAHGLIANAAILLSTSDEEGFPNTFLQAWASGTPVVSLSVDPDSAIERGALGAVAGTVDNAVITLRRLLASPESRDDIAARAMRHVADVHSEASVTAAFVRALRSGR